MFCPQQMQKCVLQRRAHLLVRAALFCLLLSTAKIIRTLFSSGVVQPRSTFCTYSFVSLPRCLHDLLHEAEITSRHFWIDPADFCFFKVFFSFFLVSCLFVLFRLHLLLCPDLLVTLWRPRNPLSSFSNCFQLWFKTRFHQNINKLSANPVSCFSMIEAVIGC